MSKQASNVFIHCPCNFYDVWLAGFGGGCSANRGRRKVCLSVATRHLMSPPEKKATRLPL